MHPGTRIIRSTPEYILLTPNRIPGSGEGRRACYVTSDLSYVYVYILTGGSKKNKGDDNKRDGKKGGGSDNTSLYWWCRATLYEVRVY